MLKVFLLLNDLYSFLFVFFVKRLYGVCMNDKFGFVEFGIVVYDGISFC